MYHRFQWTPVSHRRNGLTLEYEPVQPYFLIALAQQAGAFCFIDVGANIGAYSVLISPLVERIIAFEANDAPAREMAENFRLNDINALIREVAVSDRPGTVEFGIVSRFAGNSAVASSSDTVFAETRTVEAVTLDDELAGIDGPLAIKIDVEGHEMAVLRGGRNTLLQRQCLLQVEDYQGEVATLLEPFGYRLLSTLGPDHYFSNIQCLDPLSAHEAAVAAMIEANHERKSVVFKRGDIALSITGRSYEIIRRVAVRVMGKRL